MNSTLLWFGVGLILIVTELVTGTFYLLVLGAACVAGSAASFAGLGFGGQSVAAAAVAILGSLWVRKHHLTREQPRMPSLDVGQTARWESWIDEAGRLARVEYRGASWDAKIVGQCQGVPGEVFYIQAIHGSELTLSKTRP